MQHTEIWRRMQVAPPGIGPAAWRRHQRGVVLPQLILVLGVLAVVGGALLAVGQYTRQRAQLQIAETHRILDQARSGPIAEAWGRVGAAWRAEGARREALLAQLRSSRGRDRLRIRRDHALFVLEIIEEYRLHPDIERIRRFAIQVATCVRIGSCDQDIVAAQVGPALWKFHDQHRPYFQFEYSGMDLEPYLETIAPRPTPPPVDLERDGTRSSVSSPLNALRTSWFRVTPGRGGAGASGGRFPRAS